jgi:hypothetical protein
MSTGITDADLAEIGIQSKLLRSSILDAFEELIESKGLLMGLLR